LTIRPQARNANRHTQRGMAALETSIAQDGWIGAITVAADGETFDGSARVEKTAENGMLDEALVIDIDGTRPVVLRRTDIPNATDPRAVRLGVAANRVASLNLEWEPDVLAAIADSGVDLGSLFTDVEWAEAALPRLPEAGAGGDEFDATPEDGPTRTAVGELWSIGGKHRLLVGDCTDAANVARLMGGERADILWTDAPYNINVAGGTKDPRSADYRNGGTIENDDMSSDDFRSFLSTAFKTADGVMRPGAVYYLAHPDIYAYEFIGATRDVDWQAARPAVVQWVKDSLVFGRGDYHSRSEPMLYGWKPGAAHHAVADRTQDNVWEIPRPKASEEHPTMKPIELIERALRNSSKPNDIAIDWFLGSGTTLIAAHRTGRRCYGMEIAPRYADVILRRAEAEGLACEVVDG